MGLQGSIKCHVADVGSSALGSGRILADRVGHAFQLNLLANVHFLGLASPYIAFSQKGLSAQLKA